MNFVPLKGWKTLVVAILVTVVGALQSMDWATLVTTETAGFVLTVLGVTMAVLRFLTDSPVASVGGLFGAVIGKVIRNG